VTVALIVEINPPNNSVEFLLIVLFLQRFQKDAIWRQMQEYKREKVTLEAKVKEMTKAAAFHNDHLRTIDAWFKQVRIPSCAWCPITDMSLLVDRRG
jgi:hypothetical protein